MEKWDCLKLDMDASYSKNWIEMPTRYGFIGLLTVFNIKMDVKYETSHEVAFGIFILNKTKN